MAHSSNWDRILKWSQKDYSTDSCIIDLKSRIERLEMAIGNNEATAPSPPCATEDELWAIWDQAISHRGSIGDAIRAIYEHGRQHVS